MLYLTRLELAKNINSLSEKRKGIKGWFAKKFKFFRKREVLSVVKTSNSAKAYLRFWGKYLESLNDSNEQKLAYDKELTSISSKIKTKGKLAIIQNALLKETRRILANEL